MIAVIVFSKGYVTSGWCLEELVKIIECKKARDLTVVPIFYQVDPSHVRDQKGTFGEAFVNHEEEQRSEKVMRWRNALNEAANLSGFDSSNIRSDAELIENIVQEILEKLNKVSPSEYKDFVGIESKIQELELLVRLKLKDVSRSVGIWGVSGIGKTTLARAVFSRISSQFEIVYFQGNVREESERVGLNHSGKKLIPAIVKDRWAVSEPTFTISRFRNKKILIVFDEVPCLEQIEKLIGHLECFGCGSRIIVTARDKQVLKICGVSSDNMYEVKGLPSDEALKLFSRYAFRLDEPRADYKDLLKRVMEFAKGVPLALKVLGSSLFEKTNINWESTLYNLERNPNPMIQDVLKISYDGLDRQEKTIFLDIACFFAGAEEKFVTEILDDADFECKVGVRNLFDKSLITIGGCNSIEMHDLLQKMGEEIVKQESKDPSKRSRLWHHDDIFHVLRRSKGTEAIECVSLDISKIKEINLKCNAFLNMQNLRFLDFYCPKKSGCRFWDMDGSRWFDFYCQCFLLDKDENVDGCPYCSLDEENVSKVRALQGLEFSSHNIRYFRWFGYPLDSLPSNFAPENLCALIIPGSNIKQLWNGLQHLEKLKHINLMHSKHLLRISNLSMIPNLESLILEGCTSLIEVPSSIQCLNKLVMLNLKGCKSLGSLPTDIHSKFLTHLILSGCSNLKTVPKITFSMIYVYFDRTPITELPLIECSSRLSQLNLEDCSRLESLPSTICELKSLAYLCISGCSKLVNLPQQLGNLNRLQTLSLSRYRGQDLMVGSVWPLLSYLSSLSELDLSDCQITRLPDSLSLLCSLERLNLSRNNFE
ncbi:disease resistance-like protein DSC1 [Pistacia vera]|uniref:disease resistance-like protein DSC1 n=1 Tax=Pistacia vera TaxID=55513 RepID=UPI001262CAE7|nr:disease resistance-like protein DSC1 [Pistacia vera]XP_031269449.1 disease resistance-like protein DSC1 [Pistacia vera]XP_031269450.1 disease resistance-like protein DSC1 [Pistacia vera]XP_031269452.1 disease resistance-like protein DSC1 [Pistacia vera]